MKYVSIDIETLGLDPETCDTIEFGAVLADTDKPIDNLPKFHRYIVKKNYRGQPFAMAMHARILRRIADQDKDFDYSTPNWLGPDFADWLDGVGVKPVKCEDGEERHKIVVAGKNFQGFDMRFLRRLPEFEKYIRTHHRVMDPSMCFFDPNTDDVPPSLDECLKRAGIDKHVSHTAIDDAMDVIRVLRAAGKG